MSRHMIEFNPKSHVLGNLCSRGHEWNSTGQSIRYIQGGNCVYCQMAKNKERRAKNRKRPLPVEPIDFDEMYFLGLPCSRNHTHEDTGRSLRYKSNGACLQCTKELRHGRKHQPVSEGRYLGRLCHRQHDYECTGLTLRNKWGMCIECVNLLNRTPEQREYEGRRREQFREELRVYRNRWAAKNPERIRIYYAKSKSKPDYRLKCRVKTQEWYRKNPEQARLSQRLRSHRREARKKNNHHFNYSNEQVKQRYADFDKLCAYCGCVEATTLDHFIPVSKGGPDVISNLVPACSFCNPSKHNKDAEVWYKSQSFFSEKRWRKILKVLGSKGDGQLPLF